ncbi:MAG: hypothetical protein ACM3ZQ_10855 [Bacillota bacterium]
MKKSLRRLMVVALVVLIAIAIGTMDLAQLPVHVSATQQGSFYLAGDGAGDFPFFPPPSNNSTTKV